MKFLLNLFKRREPKPRPPKPFFQPWEVTVCTDDNRYRTFRAEARVTWDHFFDDGWLVWETAEEKADKLAHAFTTGGVWIDKDTRYPAHRVRSVITREVPASNG